MSGAYFTNIARPAFIPLIGKQALKALATSAVDSAYLNEKISLAYNEKSDGVTEKAHSASLPFTQDDIAQTLNSLLAFAKFWLALPNKGRVYKLLKEACSPQNKALIIKSELAVGKAESVEVVLPVAKEKPLTAQRMRELLDSFPEAYGMLKEGRYLLTGQTSSEKRKVDQLLGQYKGQLKQLEVIMRQGWYQAVRQEKTNALTSAPSFAYFTDEQVDTLTAFVSSLSTFAESIKQSSQGLCETPSLRDFRFWCGLVGTVGTIVAASLSLSIVLGCAVVSMVPICISLSVGILSSLSYIGFHLYENKLSAKAQEWKERRNTLTNFTEQLKNLKETAMATNLSVHGIAIKQHGETLSLQGAQINQLERQHSQEIQDLKAIIFEMKAELETLKKEKEKTVGGQSKANEVASLSSKHEAVTHCC